MELEDRGKDEEFGAQPMPKHFHNAQKSELLCSYRKKNSSITAEKRPLCSMLFFLGSGRSRA